jgi:hypothetical protein
MAGYLAAALTNIISLSLYFWCLYTSILDQKFERLHAKESLSLPGRIYVHHDALRLTVE